MIITELVEQIFAQAVALDQNGGLRNTIYADKREIYILNYDHTVLIRFRLRQGESTFSEPISFKANDYDSNDFQEEDGKIVFLTEQDGFTRKKSCGRAEYSSEDVKALFHGFLSDRTEESEEITLNKSVIGLLDGDLSHIEFSGKEGESICMIQRNIYSGGIIEIREKSDGMFHNALRKSFGPVGIKTNDFVSLFSFQDTLKFEFPSKGKDDYIIIRSLDRHKRDMTAIIACCLYDEIIKIKEVTHGGQEQKIRRRK